MFTSNQFELRQIVYLKTDPKQEARVVNGMLDNGDTIIYRLRYAKNNVSLWYESFQISAEKNIGEK